MDQDMITDITLDHLPDLSEASVSFQIPTNNASADLLLADRTDGFDLLRNVIDDDVSFAHLALRPPRGPPLTLGELTPRAEATPHPRSPTPTQVPSSSAKPSVIQRPLTLGRHSPDKRRKTPSRTKSVCRQLQSPLVSEERFHQLRAEVETLGQVDEIPSHVQIHVVEPANDSPVECTSPSRANSKLRNNALDSPPASNHRLDPLPEEQNIRQDVETPAAQDVAMTTRDDCPAEATDIAVPTHRPNSKRNPRTGAKPTVAAGGISKRRTFPATHVSKKTKSKPSRIREAHQVPPSAAHQLDPPQSVATDTEKELVPSACISGSKSENTQITPHPGTDGMAGRLVSYSQRLISSIGLYKPWPENSPTEASKDAVRVEDARVGTLPSAAAPLLSPPPQFIDDIFNAHSEPLRLSEISPHKQPPNAPQPNFATHNVTLQEGGQHDISPMRPAKKRVSMDADLPQEFHRRKKGKMMLANTDSDRRSSDEAVSQAPPFPDKNASHEDQSVTQSETCNNMRHSDSSKSTLPSARTKYRPKLNPSSQCKGPTLTAFPYLSKSRQTHGTINKGKGKRDGKQAKAASVRSETSPSGFSRLRQDERTRQGTVIESAHEHQRSGPVSTTDLPLMEKKHSATLPVAPLTKPVGFTFRVDARLGARKVEERLAVSEPAKTHLHHAVPDIKALRASRQAELIFHRDGVVPNVPVVPFFFCTEQRAKEREKFDGMVRRKEEEMLRVKEEQRRREAEEEERTIKELRRKAIPKANEIPEWYADMPKRKGTAV
ncbi:hypothetical protein J3R83DRAFT_7563 [Lanmaoa asiatica]|nr:hypothetical protein J3R83DRAFT_7563 [Lanmaoa asiatica]